MAANEAKYILLDFSKVTGIDSTGMLSFVRMMQWSQEQKITLVLTGLDEGFQKQFLQESSALAEGTSQFFADADHGIEWCENEIIAFNLAGPWSEKDISELLKSILKEENVGKLIPYLKYHEYRSGEYLIREGDAADRIYFVQSGQVTAQLEAPDKNPVRLETVNPGRTVGELGFFLGTRRAASVVANRDSVVYSLSLADLEQMERIDPEAANVFHRLSVILLCQRVMHNTATVRALERS
jgi:SulP family sulfate permease